FELGFEAEDIPLMIEVIPMSAECLVLIITKVENPEELDTRFSKFMPQNANSAEEFEEMISEIADHDDEVLDLFRRIQETHSPKAKADVPKKTLAAADTKENGETPVNVSVMYTFPSLSTLTKLARMSENLFDGLNSLYKDSKNNQYILVITNNECGKSSFNKICNMLSEYGETINAPGMSEIFLSEHHKPIIVNNALQTLAKV
ncbi:MAG: adaptor protein MecA, partial [Lachnospiraceae bacterium]|nr:adaptor protein MecA [Lachnospiraceae bacterium]